MKAHTGQVLQSLLAASLATATAAAVRTAALLGGGALASGPLFIGLGTAVTVIGRVLADRQ